MHAVTGATLAPLSTKSPSQVVWKRLDHCGSGAQFFGAALATSAERIPRTAGDDELAFCIGFGSCQVRDVIEGPAMRMKKQPVRTFK